MPTTVYARTVKIHQVVCIIHKTYETICVMIITTIILCTTSRRTTTKSRRLRAAVAAPVRERPSVHYNNIHFMRPTQRVSWSVLKAACFGRKNAGPPPRKHIFIMIVIIVIMYYCPLSTGVAAGGCGSLVSCSTCTLYRCLTRGGVTEINPDNARAFITILSPLLNCSRIGAPPIIF